MTMYFCLCTIYSLIKRSCENPTTTLWTHCIYIQFSFEFYILNSPSTIKHITHGHNTRCKTSGLASIEFFKLHRSVNSHHFKTLKIHNKLCHLFNSYKKNIFCNRFYNLLLINTFYTRDDYFIVITFE